MTTQALLGLSALSISATSLYLWKLQEKSIQEKRSKKNDQKKQPKQSSKFGLLPAPQGFGTDAIHAAQPPDPQTGAVIIPLVMSTTFHQESPGVTKGYDYSRSGNPTRKAYEECMAKLECGKYGFAFASGCAATTTISALLQPGDHAITIDDVYGGTNRFFRKVSHPSSGVNYSWVDFMKEGEFEAAFTPKTKLVWIETPTNPNLTIVDIAEIAKITHAHNAILVVDNTFLSPYFQRPLTLGADIVVNSVTKYINGHSDVVGGVVVVKDDELAKKLKFYQNSIGAIPSPFDCFMVLRGIKTLHIRMKQHESNAMTIAKFLEEHPAVARVSYPGLPSHPQHELAKKQQSGFGGMITIWLKGGLSHSKQFLSGLKIFAMAESLGGVESLAEHPAIMTHASVSEQERAKLGISDSMCRLSIGIEDVDDLLNDISDSLDALKF